VIKVLIKNLFYDNNNYMNKLINQRGFLTPVMLIALAAIGLIAFILLSSSASFKDRMFSTLYPKQDSNAAVSNNQTGNGAMSGAHYNLNLIGVPKGKTANMTGNQGSRIFVPIEGKCKINLASGDFQVLDGNCTDGNSSFNLPNPLANGVAQYAVYARALGKPGGSSKTSTCATDPVTGELYCNVESMVMLRDKGKSSFSDVSNLLLYVYADIDGDGTVERYPLFDEALKDYFWQYDNAGLKLVQLRFYQIVN
jgi:hypothetical protein